MSNTLDRLIAEQPIATEDGCTVGSLLPDATRAVSPSGSVGLDATLQSTAASIASAGTTYSGLSKQSKAYEAVAKYRSEFRAEMIPKAYSAVKHLQGITVWGLSASLLMLYFAGGPMAIVRSPLQLLMVSLAFALANYFEYYAHRYKLHNPLVHTRHSHTHHRFFTDKVMEFDQLDDAHAILFPRGAPPIMMGIALPVLALLPTLVGGWKAGATFAFTLALYYGMGTHGNQRICTRGMSAHPTCVCSFCVLLIPWLPPLCPVTYEWMHLSYHSPPDSWLGSLPGVAYLRHHHQVHHSQALMGK